VDAQKLESLAKPKPPLEPVKKPDLAATQPADLAKADEKLSSLLGKKK
jgi:hypothetical protein